MVLRQLLMMLLANKRIRMLNIFRVPTDFLWALIKPNYNDNMNKKVIRKKVRESVDTMMKLTLTQMSGQQFADIVCNALFDEKIDAGIHFKYIQERGELSSKHMDGFVDDITNQIMQRFKEPDLI